MSETMNNDIERVVCSQEEIQTICKKMGEQLATDYEGKRPLVIAVLKGAIFFMTDIVRYMDMDLTIDFIDVSSYFGGTSSTGEVKLIKDIDTDVAGREVIFIEDIIETGRTIKYLKDLLADRGASSVRICTLIDKPKARTVDVESDYVGVNLPNEFLVGYGLDYKETYRNLPYIGVLKSNVYQGK